ncbi:hypothetical protein ETI08_02600 [Macrococcoides goetzii]|nr:hypothetical protein [Macrococcus goetzii]TDM41998.1 hypothetical protein ETI10_02610 [Macrococcus goetzii]TDM48049.1 hypothetical protein ETI08_02600 [Macrococcus goetzii]
MDNITNIKTVISKATKHETLILDHLEFNRRDNEVIMNFVYQKFNPVEVHTAPHVNDPVLMDVETMQEVISYLEEVGIRYEKRKDEFI